MDSQVFEHEFPFGLQIAMTNVHSKYINDDCCSSNCIHKESIPISSDLIFFRVFITLLQQIIQILKLTTFNLFQVKFEKLSQLYSKTVLLLDVSMEFRSFLARKKKITIIIESMNDFRFKMPQNRSFLFLKIAQVISKSQTACRNSQVC